MLVDRGRFSVAYDRDGRVGIAAFLEHRGNGAPEVIWQAAMTLIERSARDFAERSGHWRASPRLEMRELRRELAAALDLARLAVCLREEYREANRELDVELLELAREAGRVRRRAQTLPAERARLSLAVERRELEP